ncbi:hypothetical protein COU61_00745 [Candidatus Pacearchaeota archaeon CG10_big_fil_rev_8_21_14_0_10_35_13]|nr:MAG: hypothetical protein COU61_00745 [Candidatus Pacearchaeota archaeon CG10_big_fil_rev_8_21_14_0_10_35_13]
MRINPPGNEQLSEYEIELGKEGKKILRFKKDFSIKPFLEYEEKENYQQPVNMKQLIISESPDGLIEDDNKNTNAKENVAYETIIKALGEVYGARGVRSEGVKIRIDYVRETIMSYGGRCDNNDQEFKETLKNKKGEEIIVTVCIDLEYAREKYGALTIT